MAEAKKQSESELPTETAGGTKQQVAGATKQQGSARSRAATPPPQVAKKVTEPEVKPATKKGPSSTSVPWYRDSDLLVGVAFLVFCAFAAYFAYKKFTATVDANGDGVVDSGVDKDANGVPDPPTIMDTSATCHANGVIVAQVCLSPIYYSGMLFYYMLYPVIALKALLAEYISMILQVITYVPMVVLSYLGRGLLWLGWRLLDLSIYLCLDRVIACLVVTVPLALMATAWDMYGKPIVVFLLTVVALSCNIIYYYGLDVFTWVIAHLIICPFQFLGGWTAMAYHSTAYWTAALTLSKVSGV